MATGQQLRCSRAQASCGCHSDTGKTPALLPASPEPVLSHCCPFKEPWGLCCRAGGHSPFPWRLGVASGSVLSCLSVSLLKGKRNLSLHTPYTPSVRNGHVSSGQDLPHLPHHLARARVQGEGTWHSWNWCDGAGARPDGAGPSRHSPRSAELAVNRDREGPLGLPREADTERFTGGKQVASTLGTECAHAPRRKPAPRGCR